MKKNTKQTILWVLKVVVGIAIIVYLLYTYNLKEIWGNIVDIPMGSLLLIVLLSYVSIFFDALASYVLFKPFGINIPIFNLFLILYTTKFYSLFLPGQIAGSAVKWNKFRQHSGNLGAQSAASILVYRGIYSLIIILLGAVCILFETKLKLGYLSWLFLLVIFVSLASIAAFMSPAVFKFLNSIIIKVVKFIPVSIVHEKALKVWNSFLLYQHWSLGEYVKAIVAILFSVLSEYVPSFVLLKVLDIPIPIYTFFWIKAAQYLIFLLPISIMGLGVRELSFLAVFPLFGVSQERTLAYSLIVLSIRIFLLLVGGLVEGYQVLIRNNTFSNLFKNGLPRLISRKTMNLFSRINKYLAPLYGKFSDRIALVLGDSHVEVFHHPLFLVKFPKIHFDVVAVPAATVSGLKNPKSKTQAKIIFNNALKRKIYQKVIICLGEVDTGYLIWYKSAKQSIPVDNMLKQSVDKYCDLISGANDYMPTIVISAPLPTIEDDKKWGEVADLRKEVTAKQLDRTKLTIDFNNQIEKFCRSKGIQYINLDQESLGDNGLIKPELKNSNKHDHHYDKTAYSKMIIRHLERII